MTHTPGPWEIHHYGDNEGDIHGSNGTLVCMMREGDTAPDQDWSADARLIAAAPDLLAACYKLIDSDAAVEEDERKHQLMLAKLLAARAVAKAEGVTTEGTNGKERSLD
jgi:hypothetical protein